MFIGRRAELAMLEEAYREPGFRMTVIYGRRRIGKSTLIAEFLKNKRGSYYAATETMFPANLRKWSEQLIRDLAPESEGAHFEDADAFFRFMAGLCAGERTVIALDELPYIAEADPSFLSVFQRAIDTVLSSSNIFLILCGSAVSFMEKEVLSEKSPLFGRRSSQLFLKPFDYRDAARFVPSYAPEEKAVVYGVTGGVAKYLSLFDPSLSLDENLIRNFFRPSGYLYEEASNLLSQEFRNVGSYQAVIEACAEGANKASELADKAHVSSAALSYLLQNLITVGIVEKAVPLTDESNKKKCRYELSDTMYLFWYKFIPDARAAIELGRGEAYFLRNVKPRLHEYMGPVFERICRQYTLCKGLDGELSCFVSQTGAWWGTDRTRLPTDIDVVGLDPGTHRAVLGECKFKNEPLGKEAYDALMARQGLIDRRYTETQFLFFSLSGFTAWIREKAQSEPLKLVPIEELYSDTKNFS